MVHFVIQYPLQMRELGQLLQDVDEQHRPAMLEGAINQLPHPSHPGIREALDGINMEDLVPILLDLLAHCQERGMWVGPGKHNRHEYLAVLSRYPMGLRVRQLAELMNVERPAAQEQMKMGMDRGEVIRISHGVYRVAIGEAS